MKGEKQVGKITSAERGQVVTICAAVSGDHIPPFMIFPVNWHNGILKETPPGTKGTTFIFGCMNAQNFVKFKHHFNNHGKLSLDNKVGGTLRMATTVTFHFDFSKFTNT